MYDIKKIKIKFLLSYVVLVLCPIYVLYAEDSSLKTPHRWGVNHTRTIPGSTVNISSPAVADIDSNLNNGKEIIVGSRDGSVRALLANGETLWNVRIPGANCKKRADMLFSSPAVGNLYNDRNSYVIVGYGGVSPQCDGGVIAIRGSTGAIAWQFSMRAFERKERIRENFHGVMSTPALQDTDGDGFLEVAFGSLNRNVFLLEHTGALRWYYHTADTVFSSPLFENVDNDTDLELIVGTDISKNPYLRPPTPDGGYLYAIKTRSFTKSKKPRAKRIEFRDKDKIVWYRPFDQVLQGSPALGDVLPENPGNELVIASGCYFPENSRNKRGNWLKIINPRNGKTIKTLALTTCSNSSPALGDIDGDGLLEIVTIEEGRPSVGGDGRTRVVAFNPRIGEKIWSTIPRTKGRNDQLGAFFMSPIITDITGDKAKEVLVGNYKSITVLAGHSGTHLSCDETPCRANQFSFETKGKVTNTPAVADLDSDGGVDVIAAQGSYISAWTLLQAPLTVPYVEELEESWSMFRGGSNRSGKMN
jgi:outer membrane protein assembly factor BamB